jgi:hypothetical protein
MANKVIREMSPDKIRRIDQERKFRKFLLTGIFSGVRWQPRDLELDSEQPGGTLVQDLGVNGEKKEGIK